MLTKLWVPNHIGIEGNEKADELVWKGAETLLYGPKSFFGSGEIVEQTQQTYCASLTGMEEFRVLCKD